MPFGERIFLVTDVPHARISANDLLTIFPSTDIFRTLDKGMLCFLAYCPWGLFQQYLLNGYFANRLLAVASARRVPLIAAALFSGTHLPNWFLMLVTFALGYCSTKIYLKYRNMYFLGLAHGTIGTLLFVVVPDSISHHLTVGPGFFLR